MSSVKYADVSILLLEFVDLCSDIYQIIATASRDLVYGEDTDATPSVSSASGKRENETFDPLRLSEHITLSDGKRH
jgi:hypothetical protein